MTSAPGVATAPARPTVHLHIGARKSGTTSIQMALGRSRDQLAAQGLNVALTTEEAFARFARPLKQLGGPREPDDAAVQGALDLLAERLDRPQRRHLVSVEGLAELHPEGVAVLCGALEGFEVHVVLTVRPWDRVIPSEWQQMVKERGTLAYADFLAGIQQRSTPIFHRRQDAPGIVRRWLDHLPADRVHVIPVPAGDRAPGEDLAGLFGRAVGFDAGLLGGDAEVLNTSLSYTQAEVLRRVNAALPAELRDRDGYRRAVRGWLVNKCLVELPRSGDAVRIPDAMGEWCAGEMRRQRDELAELGVDLVGDPDDLTPPVRTGSTEASAEQVAAQAVDLVAALTALRFEERRTATGPGRRRKP